MVRRVCAVCKVVYGEKEPVEDLRETHGYCHLCFTAESLPRALELLHELPESERREIIISIVKDVLRRIRRLRLSQQQGGSPSLKAPGP